MKEFNKWLAVKKLKFLNSRFWGIGKIDSELTNRTKSVGFGIPEGGGTSSGLDYFNIHYYERSLFVKKLISILLCSLVFGISAFAYELPNAFWKPNEQYVEALNTSNYYGIIEHGKKLLDVVAGEPENQQILEIKLSRAEQVGLAYETLGDYQTAAQYFSMCNEYAKKSGSKEVEITTAKRVLHYRNDIRIYKESKSPVLSFNAKLEPDKGVFFGLTSDSPVKDSVSGRSAILLHDTFGNTDTSWMEKILQEAKANGQVVDFAWNVQGEGSEIATVSSQQGYITDVLKLIEKYNSVPVYIRFASEVNVWGNRPNPEQYKEAFRTVSRLAKQHTTNTAIVWSVNEVSAWGVDMNDYYPGDEYVDWVGASLYLKKYFQGSNTVSKLDEVLFNTGKNADPVKALDEIITKYGNRKPIMIGETGVSHNIRTLGENDTAWAKLYLSKLTQYVPMVYPQVKMICYFDKVIPSEHSDYALSTNPELLAKFKTLVTAPHFIQNGRQNEAVSYTELGYDYINVSANDSLYTYAHIYNYENPAVSYYIDGVLMGTVYELPYKFTGLNKISEGNHTLTVKVEAGGTVLSEKTVMISVSKEISIIINGQKVDSDTSPVIVGGRTLVPIRVIANGLGAEVQWVAETREVIIKKGSDTLKLQIDNSVMTKNNEPKTLDVAPSILNGRTMVPIRAVGEAFETQVSWDGVNRHVIISK